MKGKKLTAKMLMVTMLAYGIPGWTWTAPIKDAWAEEKSLSMEKASPSAASSNAATPGNAQEEDIDSPNTENTENKEDNHKETEKAAAMKSKAGRTYGTDGEYQLEAEDNDPDTGIAVWDNVNSSGEGNRAELQQYGSVTYDLSKITDFQAGKYMIFVRMNGNSTKVKIRVNGEEKGEISKENSGWGYADLKEYSYCWLELAAGDALTVAEGEGQYTHLDWTKLIRLDADYWVEAEDSAAVTLIGGSQIHGDGDRAEINSGQGIQVDLSKISGFSPGRYELHAGVNGTRTQWGVTADDTSAGNMAAPGGGKFEKGTCVDVKFETEIELLAESMIKLSDIDGSWGHVDYIRLIRTGDITEPEQPDPPEPDKPTIPDPVTPGEDGSYQLEAESTDPDTGIAAWNDKVQPNKDEGNRAELQQNGAVTYNLSKIADFPAGNYMLIARMNGNSKEIRLLVDGSVRGTIIKAELGFGNDDLSEFYFHGTLELEGTETITLQEGENQYAHLDWIKLVPVDLCYWVEAEDSVAAACIGGSKVHDDGDRVEINSGEGIRFDLSKVSGFPSGIYELYAGVNGERTQWGVTADDKAVGNMAAPGGGKFEKGTCVDVKLGTEIELSAESVIKLSDIDGSWGHVDYLRLVRTGDILPRFDQTDKATGVRVTAPQGFFPDGTAIVTDSIPRSVMDEIREEFKEDEQKVFFYGFHLGIPKASRERLLNEENELEDADGQVIAYLPLPVGYSEESELYFAREPGEDLEPVAQTWLEGKKLCFSMETNGGMYVIADENLWKFEGENYYEKTTDAGQAADLQPTEEIVFSIPEDKAFENGEYNFLMRVCGGQNYTLFLNGREISTVVREGSDWGDYQICTSAEAVKLTRGGSLTLRADDHYGWVDYICLIPVKAFADENNGIIVEADPGVVPAGAEFFIELPDSESVGSLQELFGFTEESAPAMCFYRFSLQLDGSEISSSGVMKVQIPVPDDFVSLAEARTARAAYTEDDMSLYRISEDERKSRISFKLVEDGTYVECGLEKMGIYGLVNQPPENELQYSAVDYYDQTTGDNGEYADLQPGDSISIPVKDILAFVEGNYLLSVYSSGNRTKMMVLVNGVPVGMISRERTDWTQMNEAALPGVLSLTQEDVLTIYAPGLAEAGPYGWVDYVELKETDQLPLANPKPKTKITLEAEDVYPDELEAEGMVANVNHCLKKVEFPILAADGFAEDDYHFTLYTTGTMRNWAVRVNGVLALSGSRDGSGYEMRHMTREFGSELLHLKPGDILSVEFLEQDTDNYGNWVDKIVLNSRRKIAGADFFGRTGARIPVEMAGKTENVKLVKTAVSEGKLIYQGEGYYKAQADNPAADLQPGEQILIPVSDHSQFSQGLYRLTVRSCGNREIFRVKVNGWTVGNITRKETNYGMDSMTEDSLGCMVSLKPGDVLIIEGQTGGKYGWVDYVSLSRVSSQAFVPSGISEKNYVWEGENYYPSQKDNPAADLQPMEEIVIPLNTNAEFVGGTYYLAVKSNGNRTAMVINKNGERVGSIARNETNFDMGSMTMDVLQRPISLQPEDVISIYAPGDESGPYGWVDQMILMPAETSRPQEQNKEEYRYPAWAYGTANRFLASADLQPEEKLEIPLADDPSFMEGSYQVAVISNGTRERFDVLLNGQPVGSISREPSDYGDNGMSLDKLERVLYLKPSDVVTIVGQEGDFYGWVSALVLTPTEQEEGR